MAAISSITRAHAPPSRATSTSASVFTRPRVFVFALIVMVAWLALAVWLGHEKSARRERTFDSPARATQPAHVHR